MIPTSSASPPASLYPAVLQHVDQERRRALRLGKSRQLDVSTE